MSTPATQALQAIEMRADAYPCVIVQELRIMVKDVLALRPDSDPEDRSYADALLLKLDRLIGDQLAPSVRGKLPMIAMPMPLEAESLSDAVYPHEAALACA